MLHCIKSRGRLVLTLNLIDVCSLCHFLDILAACFWLMLVGKELSILLLMRVVMRCPVLSFVVK